MPGDARNRDPLAISIAVISLAVQLGLGLYWGGKIETRVETVEKRQEQGETRSDAVATSNAAQNVTIAVITTQLTTIQSTVERIDKTLQEKR